MNLGVDFDHTLFATNDFYNHLERQLDVSVDRIKMTVQDIVEKRGEYRLNEHADRLGIQPHELEQAYQDAPQFMNANWLQEQAQYHRIIVVTRDSHTGWQDVKTRYAGLKDGEYSEYVDEVRIVSGEETKYFDDLDVLIDDTSDELQDIEEYDMVGIQVAEPADLPDMIEAQTDGGRNQGGEW